MRLLRLGRVPRRASIALLVGASACAGASCTYDFTVGRNAPRADGGANDDAGAPDDGGAKDDAGTVTDAAPAVCADLAAKMSNDRESAIRCDTSMGDICDEFVLDECGCAVGVVDPTDPNTRVFTDEVTRFKGAGCTPTCPQQSCSRSTIPGQYFCQHGPGTTVGTCTRSF